MKTATANTLLVALSCLFGCADQDTPQRTEQPPPQAEKDQAVAKQPLPVWQPLIGRVPNLTKEAQRELANAYASSPEDNPGVENIIGGDCSWYCGSEANNVVASSLLWDDGPFSYEGNNAHDLRYDTAWVEGVEGPGIGETLTYVFSNKCPRINTVLIHNGYIKNQDVWIKNNRAKTLELSINGKPTARLALNDTRAEQSFDLKALGVGLLGRRADGEPLILTFKILNVYPGTTYDDTAISEIYFDGIDVH